MMKFTAPPGYVRTKPPARPKLDPFIAVIDRILFDDKSRPRKQQHTAKRIFERLRDEYGFTGGLTIVKDYVAGWRQRAQEMFVPLEHPPGHAQVDFGEAIGVIGGVERKIHFFAFDLPHSDACFVVGYPAETTEAFCDGHVRAFSFFGGVPQSILYDNLWTPPAQGDTFGVSGVESMDASRARRYFWRQRRGMHESIRPVAGLFTPLALMGVRCIWPHNTIGLEGLVVNQAWKLRSLPTSHQLSPRIRIRPPP